MHVFEKELDGSHSNLQQVVKHTGTGGVVLRGQNNIAYRHWFTSMKCGISEFFQFLGTTAQFKIIF